jgi:hypothetical protein
VTPGLALDLATAAVFLQCACNDEAAAGHDPRPKFLRSFAVLSPAGLSEAPGLCLDVLMGQRQETRICSRACSTPTAT